MQPLPMQLSPAIMDPRGRDSRQTMVDVDRELDFWRRRYRGQPEAFDYICFVELEPAIRVAIAAYLASPWADFDALEEVLARMYRRVRGTSSLSWFDVRQPCRRAFERLQSAHTTAIPR